MTWTGNALYIRRANKRYPDDDPAVKAVPHIFDKISDDAPPEGRGEGGQGEGARRPTDG